MGSVYRWCRAFRASCVPVCVAASSGGLGQYLYAVVRGHAYKVLKLFLLNVGQEVVAAVDGLLEGLLGLTYPARQISGEVVHDGGPK